MPVCRRRFLAAGGLTLAATALRSRAIAVPNQAVKPGYKAVVIGRTGGGGYGHGFDRIFEGIDSIEVAAVADPDPAGRAEAVKRSGKRSRGTVVVFAAQRVIYPMNQPLRPRRWEPSPVGL